MVDINCSKTMYTFKIYKLRLNVATDAVFGTGAKIVPTGNGLPAKFLHATRRPFLSSMCELAMSGSVASLELRA